MKISCEVEVNGQTQQLQTIATILVPKGTEKEIEERARALPTPPTSFCRREGKVVLGFPGEVSKTFLTQALQAA